MRLLSSPPSPFGRKVKITASLKGLRDRIEVVATDTTQPVNDLLHGANPLGKIPALILDDGRTVYDSHVICEYLDLVGSGPALFPKDTDARIAALTLAALADGVTDAGILIVYEKRFRPEDKYAEGWVTRQQGKIDRSLDWLEKNPPQWRGTPHYGDISLACAFGHLDFRHGGRWRQGRPALAAWLDRFAAAVPSFGETMPH